MRTKGKEHSEGKMGSIRTRNKGEGHNAEPRGNMGCILYFMSEEESVRRYSERKIGVKSEYLKL